MVALAGALACMLPVLAVGSYNYRYGAEKSIKGTVSAYYSRQEVAKNNSLNSLYTEALQIKRA